MCVCTLCVCVYVCAHMYVSVHVCVCMCMCVGYHNYYIGNRSRKKTFVVCQLSQCLQEVVREFS